MSKLFKPVKGFTLVELITVVAIIGILSSIVVVGLGSSRGQGRDNERRSDVKEIQLALRLYAFDNNIYPSTGGQPRCLGFSSAEDCWVNVPGDDVLNASLAPYISGIPADPVSSRVYNGYIYRSPGSYWLPAANGGPVTGSAGSYSIAWQPDGNDTITPTAEQCDTMGGTFAKWDIHSGDTDGATCNSGGVCRQCGILVDR